MMNIEVLGAHNCESTNARMASLLIDGVLALDAGALTSTLPLSKQSKLKAVLISHQHYDHIRDIPALAMSQFLQGESIDIYANSEVLKALSGSLLNGELYPKFLEYPPEKPAVKFHLIEPYKIEQIEGYSILAVMVNHSILTFGYQITSPGGQVIFYTGDTGPNLSDCWKHISPQLIIIEVTAPNSYEAFGREAGHLTPSLLKQELISFTKTKGYLPQVIALHINPYLEEKIKKEIALISKELSADIILAREGMQLHL